MISFEMFCTYSIIHEVNVIIIFILPLGPLRHREGSITCPKPGDRKRQSEEPTKEELTPDKAGARKFCITPFEATVRAQNDGMKTREAVAGVSASG